MSQFLCFLNVKGGLDGVNEHVLVVSENPGSTYLQVLSNVFNVLNFVNSDINVILLSETRSVLLS